MIKTLEEYNTIITDMDGTLYYQFPVRLCMIIEMLFHFWKFRDFLIIARYRKMAEKGINEKERFSQLPSETRCIINEWMNKRPLKYIQKYKDYYLIHKLNELHKKEKIIVVYSDYPAIEKVRNINLETDYIFHSSNKEINCMKPDSSGLLNILKITNSVPEKTLFIGDRYSKDGECAKNANIDFVILGKTKSARINNNYAGIYSDIRGV